MYLFIMHFPASPKEDAVSPVIGTILLVALTVVLTRKDLVVVYVLHANPMSWS